MNTNAINDKRVGIIGCGPGGGMAGLLASRMGASTTVFDARVDPRIIPADESRSFSLTLSASFVDSLGDVGESIRSRSQRIIGRTIYWPDGREVTTKYGDPTVDAFHAIPRNTLSNLFKNELEALDNPVLIRDKWEVVRVDTSAKQLVARNLHCDPTDRCCRKTFDFDFVIDGSGVNSRVRAQLNGYSGASYSRQASAEAYISLHISPDDARNAAFPNNSLLFLYGIDDSFAIGVPQRCGNIDVLLIGDPAALTAYTEPTDGLNSFIRTHPILANAIPDAGDQLGVAKPRAFSTFRQADWAYGTRGYVIGIGDAVHACPPYFGTGSVMAMQDAEELIKQLAVDQSPAAAAVAYQQARKPVAERYQDDIPFQSRLLQFGLRGHSAGTTVA